MNLTTKFNFGDRVWKIWTAPREVFNKCGFCGGSGRLEGLNGEEIKCPECYGNGGHKKCIHEGWRIVGELTIGQVQIAVRAEDPVGDPLRDHFSNYGPQKAMYKEEYMCKESGIGSGSIHYADTLWATKADAQIECNKRNAEDTNEDNQQA